MKKEINRNRMNLLLYGEIQEFQVKNLQQFPFVFLEHVDEARVEYDFTQENGDNLLGIGSGTITYDFQTQKKDFKDINQDKLEHLTISVKILFWKETKVEYKVNGKKWTIKKQ